MRVLKKLLGKKRRKSSENPATSETETAAPQ